MINKTSEKRTKYEDKELESVMQAIKEIHTKFRVVKGHTHFAEEMKFEVTYTLRLVQSHLCQQAFLGSLYHSFLGWGVCPLDRVFSE